VNYYKGRYIPKNPQKYEGDPTAVIYRSSWELRFMRWADTNFNVIKWCSEEIVIPYICPTDNKLHRYFVDFRIQTRDKEGRLNTYLIEIKPESQTKPPAVPKRMTQRFLTEAATWVKNEAKWKAANDYSKDRGWKFMILTEKHLGV
jgi:hypothetical protein